MTRLIASLLSCSLPLLAQSAEVEFTEVLVDPVGPNAGAQLVELHNRGNLTADTTGWHLVTTTGSYALPAVQLPPGVITLLHLGQVGASTMIDIYLPTAAALTASDSLALFRSAQTSNPGDVVDFVAWGGGQGAIAAATTAGQWPALTASAQLPGFEGHTIAHFDRMVYGSRDVPEAWFADGTPTLGGENDGGGIFAGGYGCPQLSWYPVVGSGAEDNRPWLGETWQLDAYYLPATTTSTLFLGMGLTSTAPIQLDPFGMPGCLFELQVLGVRVFALPAGSGAIQLSLPNDPGLAGLELRLQGLVTYPGANALGMLPTRVIHAYLGLR